MVPACLPVSAGFPIVGSFTHCVFFPNIWDGFDWLIVLFIHPPEKIQLILAEYLRRCRPLNDSLPYVHWSFRKGVLLPFGCWTRVLCGSHHWRSETHWAHLFGRPEQMADLLPQEMTVTAVHRRQWYQCAVHNFHPKTWFFGDFYRPPWEVPISSQNQWSVTVLFGAAQFPAVNMAFCSMFFDVSPLMSLLCRWIAMTSTRRLPGVRGWTPVI